MDERNKRYLKLEILLVGITILFTIFIHYNSSSRVMNSSCEQTMMDKGISCDYPRTSPKISPILD